MRAPEKFIGLRFGRIQIIGFDDIKLNTHKIRAKCLCDCGKETLVFLSSLRSGNTKSCGCYHREISSSVNAILKRTHGLRKTPEHRIWSLMKHRCFNENSPAYKNYGGRGITVCDRWKNSFADFYDDIGPRPSPTHELDRIDNNGNYEPNNVRWATSLENGRNKRNNHRVTINGETQCLSKWLEIFRIKPVTYYKRIKSGLSDIEAITKPLQGRFGRPREEMQ